MELHRGTLVLLSLLLMLTPYEAMTTDHLIIHLHIPESFIQLNMTSVTRNKCHVGYTLLTFNSSDKLEKIGDDIKGSSLKRFIQKNNEPTNKSSSRGMNNDKKNAEATVPSKCGNNIYSSRCIQLEIKNGENIISGLSRCDGLTNAFGKDCSQKYSIKDNQIEDPSMTVPCGNARWIFVWINNSDVQIEKSEMKGLTHNCLIYDIDSDQATTVHCNNSLVLDGVACTLQPSVRKENGLFGISNVKLALIIGLIGLVLQLLIAVSCFIHCCSSACQKKTNKKRKKEEEDGEKTELSPSQSSSLKKTSEVAKTILLESMSLDPPSPSYDHMLPGHPLSKSMQSLSNIGGNYIYNEVGQYDRVGGNTLPNNKVPQLGAEGMSEYAEPYVHLRSQLMPLQIIIKPEEQVQQQRMLPPPIESPPMIPSLASDENRDESEKDQYDELYPMNPVHVRDERDPRYSSTPFQKAMSAPCQEKLASHQQDQQGGQSKCGIQEGTTTFLFPSL